MQKFSLVSKFSQNLPSIIDRFFHQSGVSTSTRTVIAMAVAFSAQSLIEIRNGGGDET